MPTKEELGRRLRVARFERNLTLKQVAVKCGMSATHISEVERGKTSPTIGALQRIAAALGEKPAYFVREEVSEPVRHTAVSARCDYIGRGADGAPLALQFVSPGISGGYVQLLRRTMSPGQPARTQPRVGEMVLICVRGSMKVTVGEESWTLREGDTIHARTDGGFSTEALDNAEAEALWVLAAPVLLPF